MSDWTPLTDDELTEAETSALDTALEAVTQWRAGTVTASGRNRHGEVKWSATVADVDGRMVGFVIRPDEDDEGDVLNVVVATVPADAVVIPRSVIPDYKDALAAGAERLRMTGGYDLAASVLDDLAALLSGATTEGDDR